jgi:hypothetical protein
VPKKKNKKNPEEIKIHESNDQELKPDKRTKKMNFGITNKPKRLGIKEMKDYSSQANLILANQNAPKLSPSSAQTKIYQKEFRNKMQEMLKVNCNVISESHNSIISSPSKREPKNRLAIKDLNKSSSQNNSNLLSSGKERMKSPITNIFAKSEAKAAPKEDTKEKYDESDYPEFDSDSMMELEEELCKHQPKDFSANKNDLKTI